MNAFLDILQHPFVDAIGWALLHFFWQGALVAGALALGLYLFRGASPNTRYTLCIAALLLLLLLPAATVLQRYLSTPVSFEPEVVVKNEPVKTTTGIDPQPVMIDKPLYLDPPVEPVLQPSLMRSVEARVYAWRHRMFIGWLIGLVFFTIRMAGGLYTLSRLRKNASLITDIQVDKIFVSLMGEMGIKSHVRLRQSKNIQQPILIGWLKPMVLLPASLVAGMPPAQIKAILAHELAHVRRHDYLVLLGQSVMETLFFYHPAVWWVSYRLRVEREYCCDAVAADVTGKAVYAQALAKIEVSRMNLTLGAGDGRLVDRIRHLVVPSVHTGKLRMSWTTLVTVLIGCSALIVACSREKKTDPRPAEEIFREANELARAGSLYEAVNLAEIAAEKGSLCAFEFLTEVTHTRIGGIWFNDSTRAPEVQWAGQDEETSKYWAEQFADALKLEAMEGNTDAMMMLAGVYSSPWGWREHIPKDSLFAREMMKNAAEAGNGRAMWFYGWMYVPKENKEERLTWYRKAALNGEDQVFSLWAYESGDWFEDPRPYFNVASIAIENEAMGVHRWIGRDLKALEEEVRKGDEIAIEWMAIADSLQLHERLATIPQMELPRHERTMLFCPDVTYWRYPQKSSQSE